jgi:hypothetical protein
MRSMRQIDLRQSRLSPSLGLGVEKSLTGTGRVALNAVIKRPGRKYEFVGDW